MNAVTKNLTDALRHPSARLAQILNVWIGTLDLDLDVLKFKVKAGLCEDYKVDVTVTSPQLDIDGKTVVGRRAGLQIDERVAVPSVDYVAPVNHEAATFNGVVTRCKRIGTNRDEATYKIRIEPRFAALCKQVQKSDVFSNVTFQELVTQLLIGRTNFDAFDVEFHLEGAQEKMEQIVMYEESVWDMITRHAKRKGIAWFYKQARGQDGQLDTLVFTDNPRGYVRSIDIPLMPDAPMDVFADQQLHLSSANANVLVNGKTKAVLASGGAAIKIENGSVEVICPGDFRIKAGSFTFEGPENADKPLPGLPASDFKPTNSYPLTR
ncbi:contractile injection system protein, VgrG/Pvc8 family [Caballeronia sp. ATUFL_M1_KS5A]|uniref:contractile injection system protein, VgrG/Pvc8 family n=1 Tax=Caballeronia sp. ATUFL_M1_KS5A TaxID=2921778 RepID=UPI0020280BEF|nr:contractile injection system protein, VgrG/Pvc8 family [Caballeronia sp. ATUFL_M1_KS5A]